MFNKTLNIIIFTAFCTANLFFAANSYANISKKANFTEVIADWEYAEDKNINDRLILDNLVKVDNINVQTKSCSSLRAIKEIEYNRQKLATILENSINCDKITLFSKICADLLTRYAKISINSLTDKEKQIVQRIKKSNVTKNIINTKQLSTEQENHDKVCIFTKLLITTTTSYKNNKNPKENIKQKQLIVFYDNHKVNLLDYSLSGIKANYYNLILYIWEDNPEKERNIKTTFLSFSLINESFQILQTSSTNIKKLKFQNIQTGLTKVNPAIAV